MIVLIFVAVYCCGTERDLAATATVSVPVSKYVGRRGARRLAGVAGQHGQPVVGRARRGGAVGRAGRRHRPAAGRRRLADRHPRHQLAAGRVRRSRAEGGNSASLTQTFAAGTNGNTPVRTIVYLRVPIVLYSYLVPEGNVIYLVVYDGISILEGSAFRRALRPEGYFKFC